MQWTSQHDTMFVVLTFLVVVSNAYVIRTRGFTESRVIPCEMKCEITSDVNRAAHATAYHIPGPLPKEFNDPQPWLALSMESEKQYPQLLDLRLYDGNMTTRLDSTIPVPYATFDKFKFVRTYNKTALKAAAFIARNCKSLNQREDFVKELSKCIPVHSLSDCNNNMKWPDDIPRGDKVALLKRYTFYLAAENSNSWDYVTEKVYDSLQAGAVPIYYGASNVKSFVPRNSIIHIKSIAEIKAICPLLQELLNNSTTLASYHKWRKRKKPHKYQHMLNFTKTDVWCRACRYIRAYKKGYKWNQSTQTYIKTTPKHSEQIRDMRVQRDKWRVQTREVLVQQMQIRKNWEDNEERKWVPWEQRRVQWEAHWEREKQKHKKYRY